MHNWNRQKSKKQERGGHHDSEKVPEINLTDDTLDNIIKMAPFLDEKSQDRVFGMILEAVKSLEHDKKKAG